MPRGIRKVQSNQMDIMDKIKAKLRFVDRVKDLIVKLEEEIGERVGTDDVTVIARASTSTATKSSSLESSPSDPPKRRGRPPGSGRKKVDVAGEAQIPATKSDASSVTAKPKKEPTNLPENPEDPDSKPKKRGRPKKQPLTPAAHIAEAANGLDHSEPADDGDVELEEVVE